MPQVNFLILGGQHFHAYFILAPVAALWEYVADLLIIKGLCRPELLQKEVINSALITIGFFVAHVSLK